MSMLVSRRGVGTAILLGAFAPWWRAHAAAPKLYAYNQTTNSDFRGVYLAPAGTQNWGPNQTLNDKDRALDTSERLTLSDLSPGHYDVKLVDKRGRTCMMKGIDLTKERSFEIRDKDLNECR
jgi:hypothetical protein